MHRRRPPPASGSINGILAATSCLPAALFLRPGFQREAGLDLTPAAVWRLLTEDGECWGFIRGLAAGQGPYQGAEQQKVIVSASSPLYRNALIDIPQVLINKRTHAWLGFVAKVYFCGL